MIKKIKTKEDISDFIRQLISESTNVRPDDDFKNYSSLKESNPNYSSEEAGKRNKLMRECFHFCEKRNIDSYDHVLGETLNYSGINKFIPLSSQHDAAGEHTEL